jgi:hypothetical protein
MAATCETYPAAVSFAFQNGRTSLAKYKAKPSRLPLKMAEPLFSAVELLTLSLKNQQV